MEKVKEICSNYMTEYGYSIETYSEHNDDIINTVHYNIDELRNYINLIRVDFGEFMTLTKDSIFNFGIGKQFSFKLKSGNELVRNISVNFDGIEITTLDVEENMLIRLNIKPSKVDFIMYDSMNHDKIYFNYLICQNEITSFKRTYYYSWRENMSYDMYTENGKIYTFKNISHFLQLTDRLIAILKDFHENFDEMMSDELTNWLNLIPREN